MKSFELKNNQVFEKLNKKDFITVFNDSLYRDDIIKIKMKNGNIYYFDNNNFNEIKKLNFNDIAVIIYENTETTQIYGNIKNIIVYDLSTNKEISLYDLINNDISNSDSLYIISDF
jgi:hypothetical protein